MNKQGHPTKKKKPKRTDSPPLISIGTRERKMLQYLLEIKDLERFSVRGYSRISKIPRTTVYRMLDKLIDKDLIEKPHLANYKIISKGKNILDATKGSGQVFRRGCPDKRTNLSTHYLKYKLKNIDRTKFKEGYLKRLNAKGYHTVDLRNLKITYVYFEDATIIIKPKTILIRIHDILTKDIEESHFKTFEKALKYTELLESIGIHSEGMELESGHYARIESMLADVLYKKFGKYYVESKKGVKFWIDSSTPHRIEDETTDPIAREKIDQLINDVPETQGRFSDIDKIIDGLSIIEFIERERMRKSLKRSKELLDQDLKVKNYFG